MESIILSQTQQFSLTGEVVEIFKHGDKPVTGLFIQPFTLNLDNITDVHLGETANIEVTISIHSINFQSNIRRHT